MQSLPSSGGSDGDGNGDDDDPGDDDAASLTVGSPS